MPEDTDADRLSTGIPGLDTVLRGGLIPRRGYMVTGPPGAGKTILGLHYLTAGAESGESVLFVNLEESTADVKQNARTLGFDLDGVDFLDLSPGADVFAADQSYTVFEPDEVERPELTDEIRDRIEEVDPDRVFVDPVTQLRQLSPDDYQFRKQISGLVEFLKEQDATVVFTSQATERSPDDDLQFLSDGTVVLDRGREHRSVEVPKFRGSDTESGTHTVRITDGGLEVFPSLRPREHERTFTGEQVSSGVPEVDELVGGGLERGTVTILSGPTGVGKTTLGSQFMKEAAGRGERSVIYMFEESRETFLERSASVNIPAREMCDRGTLGIEEIEPLRRSPDEFAAMVREEVEERDAKIVMLDGIEGYRLSLQGREEELGRELNALARYLRNMGVTVVLVDTVDNVTGDFQPTKGGISYLGDNIVFLRYLELQGELRKAIGVLKKRNSDFERMLREFQITQHGIKVGKPLTNLRGVLSGEPEFVGETGLSADTPGADRG